MNSGVQATLTNSGTISGTSNVLYIYSAGTDVGIGSITNSGTISASNGYVTEINNVVINAAGGARQNHIQICS